MGWQRHPGRDTTEGGVRDAVSNTGTGRRDLTLLHYQDTGRPGNSVSIGIIARGGGHVRVNFLLAQLQVESNWDARD